MNKLKLKISGKLIFHSVQPNGLTYNIFIPMNKEHSLNFLMLKAIRPLNFIWSTEISSSTYTEKILDSKEIVNSGISQKFLAEEFLEEMLIPSWRSIPFFNSMVSLILVFLLMAIIYFYPPNFPNPQFLNQDSTQKFKKFQRKKNRKLLNQ